MSALHTQNSLGAAMRLVAELCVNKQVPLDAVVTVTATAFAVPPLELWVEICEGSLADLRALAADDTSTPANFLEQLSRDKSIDIAMAVAANPATPYGARERLASHPHSDVRVAVITPECELELLKLLARDESDYVRTALAEETTNPKVLQLLASDECVNVARGVAGNTHTPRHCLVALAYDLDADISYAAQLTLSYLP